MNRKYFLKIYWIMQSIIVPRLRYSQTIYEEILNKYCNSSNAWLDLGCGHLLLPSWRLEQEEILVKNSKLLIGIDYDFNSLLKHRTIKNRVRGDIAQLPFPNKTFDLITANMVFEHLDNPEVQFKEIVRVLKPGGKLIFHTPNKLGYTTIATRMISDSIKDRLAYILQGRKEEDVFPAFYKINCPKSIMRFAEMAGLKLIKLKMICSSAQLIVLPPICIIELLWIRLLMSKKMKPFRTNIIAILEKSL